jgi:hypothetical protein
MKSVQDRILEAWPNLEVETTQELLSALRAQLFKAYNEELLRTGLNDIYKWVKLAKEPKADEEILGAVKDFRRDLSSAHIVRSDGAWIHFTIRVRQEGKKMLRLIAYDFEIVFPVPHTPASPVVKPGFLRVDLNPPDHPNAGREIRSHVHPGNDDLQWPAPVMTPREILAWMLGDSLRPRHPDKQRT